MSGRPAGGGGGGRGRGSGSGRPQRSSDGAGRPVAGRQGRSSDSRPQRSSDGGGTGGQRRGASAGSRVGDSARSRPERGGRRPAGRATGRDAGSETFESRDDLPPVPDDVDPSRLDRSVKAELRSLTKQNADAIARYLVAAAEALDDNPAGALAFARAARARAARVGAVREAVGIAAYHAGEWSEALNELRTARRITGDSRNLAVMADCERALGRPAQAVRLMSDPAVGGLDREARIELFIVVAGARRDLGQLDAALAVLARGGLDRDRPKPGSARLWYAYADALEAADRKEDAANWFAAVAAIDPEGELDAAERAADLL